MRQQHDAPSSRFNTCLCPTWAAAVQVDRCFIFRENTQLSWMRAKENTCSSVCSAWVSTVRQSASRTTSWLPSTWLTACLLARSPYKADAMLSGTRQGGYLYFFRRFFFNILSLLISPKWRMLSRTSHTSKHTHTDFAKDPNLVVRPQNMFWNSVSAEITTSFGKWFCHCCFDSIRIPGDQVPGSTHGVFMAKLYI